MEIRKFKLHNLGGFASLEAKLAPTAEVRSPVTVFVGGNGAGKTVLLRSLAAALSWFIARLRSDKGCGVPLPDGFVSTGKPSGAIEIKVSGAPGKPASWCAAPHQWTLAKTVQGKGSASSSQLLGATQLAAAFKQGGNCGLPLIAFYPVERAVPDALPAKAAKQRRPSPLDGYDQALNQEASFAPFFASLCQQQAAGPVCKRQLQAVNAAIAQVVPGFSSLQARRKPHPRLTIDKAGETLDFGRLSQGEKSQIALAGDLARRLALLNPGLANPLEGQGIVMIDEVDLHLHPSWQRSIIDRLTTAFPHCQFILTSHSPLAISDPKELLIYLLRNGEAQKMPSQYGNDANLTLTGVMDTAAINEHVRTKVNSLLDAIQDRKLPQARSMVSDLEQELPLNNMELVKARLLLLKQEARLAKDRQEA